MISKLPTVEKNIPMPLRRKTWVSLLTSMKVGESFIVNKKRRPSISSIAARKKVKLISRATGSIRVRFWRIK